MSEYWAILDYNGPILHDNAGELLGELATLVQQQNDAELCAVFLTPPGAQLPATDILAASGVQRLYVLEHPGLDHYATIPYVQTVGWLMQQSTPRLIVTSASTNGRDWTPRLAAQHDLTFVPGCLNCELHNDTLLTLHTLYEGRAYAQIQTVIHGSTALVTLIPGLRGTPTKRQPLRSPDSPLPITRLTPQIADDTKTTVGQVRHIAIQPPSPEEVELSVAERIVAGGRGVGKEGFTTLARFASQLGAAVGATRVATDSGWVDHARQIGATGKIVRPQLYLACGISGAAQHTSGMSEAHTIVAINPDRSAPIFALADLGLLGDANEVLPLATKLLEEHPDTRE